MAAHSHSKGADLEEVLSGPEFHGKAVVSGSVSTTSSTAVAYRFGTGFLQGESFAHEVVPGLPSGHQEQRADILRTALNKAFKSLLAKDAQLDSTDVLALGFDAMEHTLSARIGEDLQTNLITWQDTRSAAFESEFETVFGHMPGHGLAGPKLLALSRQADTRDLFENPDVRFDVLASLLNFWASGKSYLGPSEQRSQGWPVLDDGSADPRCLEQIHPQLSKKLPEYLSHDRFAPEGLQASAARAWNLPEGVPVAGALGDNQATYALFPPGTVVLSGGTSGTAFCETQGEAPVGTFGSAYNRAFLMRVQQNLGQVGEGIVGLIQNARGLGREISEQDARRERGELFALIEAELFAAPGQFEGASALAFLTGDRTPMLAQPLTAIRDFHAMIDKPIAYYELLLASMTINLCDALSGMEEFDVRPQELVLVGGLASSQWWRTLVATLTNCRCRTLEEPGMGSAQGGLVYLTWLLLHSRGYQFTPAEVSAYMVRCRDTVDTPSERFREIYFPLRERYRALLSEHLASEH